MKNLFKHLKTVHTHRKYVRKACWKMGLFWQGLLHDLSKYSITELKICKYYIGTKSPHQVCREMIGYSPSWISHYHHNKHHFEYWYDYEMATKKIVPVDMPDRYIKEMFCDRIAASKTYNRENYTQDSPLRYLLNSTAQEKMTDTTYRKLLFLLKMLAEKGEEKTFAYLKSHKNLEF